MRHAAVGHDPDRRVGQLVADEVQRELEDPGEAVVVLRRHDQHGVGAVERGEEVPGGRLPVGGVLQREVVLGRVQHLDVEGAVRPGTVGDPVAHRGAEAALAVRAEQDDESGGGHGQSSFWI